MLPKTIDLRNDLRTVVLRRCLFFILAFTSQSDVVKPAMTMIDYATFIKMPDDVRSC